MDKISVIIPVYNVEPYIRKCLDSVINQTYTNLEILCINDGSIDSSGKICDEYAKKDGRIRVFHQPNQGVAAARNIGLRNITGQYIGFVDSDDWIEPYMYEVLYKSLVDNNVTFSVVSFSMDYDDRIEFAQPREKIKDNQVLTREEMLLYAFRAFHYAGFNLVLWNKLFSTEFLLRNGIFFDESTKISDDVIFTTQIILSDNCSGIYTNKHLYHYYQRNMSLVNNKEHNLLRLYESQKPIVMADKSGYEDISIWAKREHCYKASLLAEEALLNKNEELLLNMQAEMGIYLDEYIETNKDYPERIERINSLLYNKTEFLK